MFLPPHFLLKGSYIVDKELLQGAPDDIVILHPSPQVDKINASVDDDPRVAYFRQMENGMYVRMALLSLMLGGGTKKDDEEKDCISFCCDCLSEIFG